VRTDGKVLAVFVLVLVAGFAGIWQLQKRIDQIQSAAMVEADNLTLRSPSMLKKMSLEYAPLMAAIYWTRAVQYYGEKHRLHQANLELLWPLLNIATTLDPQILPAYRFGSIFVGEKAPGGAGRPDLAIDLLNRGIQANPDEWRLYQDLGNLYYFDLKDYPKAAAAFEEGGKNPKALIWMKVMAAKIAAEGESPETSYFLWQQVYETTRDPEIKKNAEEHLILMRAELEMKAINQIAEQFEKQTGRRATRMSELVEAGLLKGVPRDPDGYPYVLGEGDKAELNLNSPLLEKSLLEKQ
jgi:tetratricopeptide (TPR) repeat protein